jgi:hypothetical protein
VRTRRAIGAVLLSALGLALTTSPAAATFHEISIREVYPGSAEHPGAEYVELQMWSPGQNFVGGHLLLTYGPAGSPKEDFLASDVPSGANQSTVLIATAEATEQFGIVPDETLPPADRLDPAAGAVCWQEIDCVSWGNFGGGLPSPAGTPAAAIPNGSALRRTIAPGCATLLEPTDDRDNSAVDLSAAFPAPRPNSVAPAEHSCAARGVQPAGTGGNQGRGAPRTILKGKPAHRTLDRTPTFRFKADEPGSSFQCKLDGKPFRRCRSPFTTAPLALGSHVFRVRARDDSGELDPSPALYRFRVIRLSDRTPGFAYAAAAELRQRTAAELREASPEAQRVTR